jgi:histidinol dehydrogenase
VREFHERQVDASWQIRGKDGVVTGQTIRPLHRVGIYVPGGAGMYPSTVIMNAVTARVAGVKDIVAVTPAGGALHPAIAFTLKQLRIDEVYKVGGAQAVAMLAFGTEKVERVDKIVGPGNSYVTLAKKEVFGTVDIDMIAGPSEILVLADETADPDWVAADLLSQAEHGSGYEAAVCVTDSMRTARFVQECVRQQVERSPKKDLLQKCLRAFGRIFVVRDWKTGCELANRIAPEHLEVMIADYNKYLGRLQNAGAVFAGPFSTEPVGDYFAGPNHVLPTSGTARFFSPLGVYDFCKRSSFIQYSEQALKKNGREIIFLAETEGFYHHAEAVRKRL